MLSCNLGEHAAYQGTFVSDFTGSSSWIFPYPKADRKHVLGDSKAWEKEYDARTPVE